VTFRVVVTGPESTGKSTLALALGERLGAPVVPEAARIHAEAHPGRTLTADDVTPIGELALALEGQAALAAPPVLVLDTDLLSTIVYARHYYGEAPAWIAPALRERRADVYLLCATDLPWTPDGVRDRPEARESLWQAFRDTLREFGCVVAPVEGAGERRLANALHAVAAHTPRVTA
jgi:nicotinamide riboside kinase